MTVDFARLFLIQSFNRCFKPQLSNYRGESLVLYNIFQNLSQFFQPSQRNLNIDISQRYDIYQKYDIEKISYRNIDMSLISKRVIWFDQISYQKIPYHIIPYHCQHYLRALKRRSADDLLQTTRGQTVQ